MAKFIVRIIASSYEQLRGLDKYHLDLKKRTARQEDTNKFIVTGILNEEQIQQVRSAGYTVEILSDISQISKQRTQEVSKVNRFKDKDGIGVG
jgi:murein tripeptide amidase MpaA